MADAILLSAYFAALPIALFEGKAIIEIVLGAGEIFAGTLQILTTGLPDIIDGGLTLIQYALTNFLCFVKILGNLPMCMFFYILDTIGQALYLPIRLTLWAFRAFLGFNLYNYEKTAWVYIDKFDCFIHSYIGFHLVHWPDNIIESCYNCCRVKTSLLFDKAGKVGDDINAAWPLIGPGIDNLSRGAYDFTHPFG